MPNKQSNAILRICASCEWIFRTTDHEYTCPKCEWVSYGARFMYGEKCYKYEITQEPWMRKKIKKYEMELLKIISEYNKEHNKEGNIRKLISKIRFNKI